MFVPSANDTEVMSIKDVNCDGDGDVTGNRTRDLLVLNYSSNIIIRAYLIGFISRAAFESFTNWFNETQTAFSCRRRMCSGSGLG